MICNQHTLANAVSSTLIPKSLQEVWSTSLKLIENASSNQVSAAVEYNQHKINVLLIQLLAINFFSQNRKEIENEINKLNNNDMVQLSPQSQEQQQQLNNPVSTLPNLTSHSSNAVNLEEYCERKLLSLSPIVGFSRKNYFVEYNISNDTQMEILSYLKPIEIFSNITLVCNQFNENIARMHQCYRYSHVFCSKHYVFESFNKVKKYCENSDNDIRPVDWRVGEGAWVSGWACGINTNTRQVHVAADAGGKIIRGLLDYVDVAPYCTMSCRPGNRRRFVNILKHGYCGETCDVNLRNFYIGNDDGALAHILCGYVDRNSGRIDNIWRCGWIDFDWTWNEAIMRNGNVFGVTYNDKLKHHEKNKKIVENCDKENDKHDNTKFGIFQVQVNVDITKEYNRHDNMFQRTIKKCFTSLKTRNDRCIISLVFHIDDVDNFTYFGSKTTLSQQLEIKKYLFSTKFNGYNNGVMLRSKRKLLDAVSYPNYCVISPSGVFYAMSDSLKEREQFNKWYAISPATREVECGNVQVSNNAVNKVYYDKEKDELWIKLLPSFALVFEDSNAPVPLEKRYIIPCGNECRLIAGKIVDPQLIDKVTMEDIKDGDKKQARYFEILREWKGFIKICVDITDEFDQFQEGIETKHTDFYHCQNMNDDAKENKEQRKNENIKKTEWDNRKYFLNGDEMPYLKYNKTEDMITYDVYVWLDSKMVHKFDSKFNFFDFLRESVNEKRVLESIFGFLHDRGSFNYAFALVCTHWYRFESVGLLSSLN